MLALTNARIYTVSDGIIENGTIICSNGLITMVGDSEEIEVPAGASVIDCKGKHITPGFIDVHTHISGMDEPPSGKPDLSEPLTPNASAVRAIDMLDPFSIAIKYARSAGFTTCYTMPGSANIFGGVGIAFKTKPAETIHQIVIEGTEQMKMALGENPKNAHNKTRMGIAAAAREALYAAKDAAAKDAPFDFKTDNLRRLVSGKMKVRIHCHRTDDIVTATRIAEEFGFDYSLEHVTEGWRIASFLAEKGKIVTVGPLLTSLYKKELWNRRLDTPAILDKAGVKICLTADEGINTRLLPFHIGICMSYGLSEEAGLRAVTSNAAELLGLEKTLGTIEQGKEAELSIFDGRLFSNFTRCTAVVIGGKLYKCGRIISITGQELDAPEE